MSYTDFDVERAERQLGLTIARRSLFARIEPVAVSAWLLESLEKGKQNELVSEKARSEFIVTPILLTVQELTNNRLQIFSGQTLNVDASRGLIGECDFILTRAEPTPVLKSPIVTLVEAKKNDIDSGLRQCVAPMYGAKLYNEQRGENISAIFGCVTTGENWQFLKLENNSVSVHKDKFYLDGVETILGVFKIIADFYENQ